MPKPFANSPQYLNNISEDFLVPIQTGNLTDDSGLPQMKYIKFSQLDSYIRNHLSNLGHFRGACTAIPGNLAVNDFFFCKTSFTEDSESFEAGCYYQYDVDGNWGEISLVFDGLLTEADIIDNLTTQATDKALSANMGYHLQQEIDELKGRGRYLGGWDCTTGLAVKTFPDLPYAYKEGDHFDVSAKGTTNYKPNGSSYTGVASTTQETEVVSVGDTYLYDGANWILQHESVNFSQIGGEPDDNVKLKAEFDSKNDDVGFRWVLQPNGDYKLGILER